MSGHWTGEASKLAHYNKRSTITSREIQTAVSPELTSEIQLGNPKWSGVGGAAAGEE